MNDSLYPSSNYYKAKRFLAICSALLFLTTLGALDLNDSGFFWVKLTSIEILPTFFLVLTLYAAAQFFICKFTETRDIRAYRTNKADFYLHVIIFLASILAFFNHKYQLLEWIESLVPSSEIFIPRLVNALIYIILCLFLVLLAFLIDFLVKLLIGAKEEKTKSIQEKIQKVLLETKWRLIFNKSSNASKTVTFLENGDIGEGINLNENRWRINGDALEILNSQGLVFSRFIYSKDKEKFLHTNDEDTLSLRNQEIVPIEETKK